MDVLKATDPDIPRIGTDGPNHEAAKHIIALYHNSTKKCFHKHERMAFTSFNPDAYRYEVRVMFTGGDAHIIRNFGSFEHELDAMMASTALNLEALEYKGKLWEQYR